MVQRFYPAVLERTTVERFFHQPFHPYTLGLQNAYPSLINPDRTLISIEGGDHSFNVRGAKRDAREVGAGLAGPVAERMRDRIG